MTENEAIEALKLEGGLEITGRPIRVAQFFEGIDVGINALKEIQKYRELEKRLTGMFSGELSLETVVDELERQLKEPNNPHPINAKILTYEDAAAWDAYHAIGTPEECLWNKDFLDFLSGKMKPGDFKTYLRLYNALEEKGCGV